MDSITLTSLKAAFDAAPSAELAKIIAFELIESGDTDDLAIYVSEMDDTLNEDELEKLAQVSSDTSAHKAVESLAQKLNIETCSSLVQAQLGQNNFVIAKKIYLSARNRDPRIIDNDLESVLEVDPQRTKLKVVEKADVAQISNLSRYREKSTDFSDVIGLEKIKKQIHKKIILPFHSPSLFQRFKKKIGGGVLLYGPPGCGKTLLARATAGECSASFFNIEVSDVLDMYVGESEQKLHAIFEKARSETPSVLFFDELEALAGKREHARSVSSANTVSQFLTELDGFAQNNEGVLVLASTNVPWAIDSAFLRPGRFDRMFFVPPPDRIARQGILEHHLKGRPFNENINLELISKNSPGYSGADLANLIEMAADEAIDETIETSQETSIGMQHFKDAIEESRATTTEWLTTARNYARYANDGGRYNDVLDFIKKHS